MPHFGLIEQPVLMSIMEKINGIKHIRVIGFGGPGWNLNLGAATSSKLQQNNLEFI